MRGMECGGGVRYFKINKLREKWAKIAVFLDGWSERFVDYIATVEAEAAA
jgi:hypothetical protein